MIKSRHYCFAITAHVDAGKTTLSESILYNTGVIRKAGRVDHGTSYFDSEKEERERGITIFSKQALFQLGEKDFTLIDTPGHTDFSAETERTLSVIDFAVMIISAPDGIHGHDLTLWRLLESYSVPVFVFVNKMDQPGTDTAEVLRKLRERLGGGFVDLTPAIRYPSSVSETELTEMYEQIAVLEDELTESFLETGTLKKEDIGRLIGERKLFPCCFGSALKNEGVTELLRLISEYIWENEYPEEFGARIYKISRDKKGSRLSHIRLTGGSLRTKESVSIRNRTGEYTGDRKVNRILAFSGSGFKQTESAEAGMTVILDGIDNTEAGGTMGAEPAGGERLMVPLFSSDVTCREDIDPHTLYTRLKELEEEIPEISVEYDDRTNVSRIRLMGDIQTEIISSLAAEKYGLRLSFSDAAVVYKEALTAPVIAAGHFEPLRHYAEVHLLIEPGERNSGIEITTGMNEDVLPRHFQRLILTNIGEKKHRGVLTGSELTDVRITLINGKAHDKHTEGGDFREAVYRAIRSGLMKAADRGEVMLLEPYYSFEIRVPEANTGRAMNDLAVKAESFTGPEISGGMSVFTGKAAVSSMGGYAQELMAYTGGFGEMNAEFCGYGPCIHPEEALEGSGYDPEADIENPSGSVFCTHGAGYYVPWNEADGYMHLSVAEEEERLQRALNINETEGVANTQKSKNISSVAEKFLYTAKISYQDTNNTEYLRRESRENSASDKQDYLGAGLRQDRELEEIFLRNLGGNKGKNTSAENGWSRERRGRSVQPVTEHVEIRNPKKQYLLVDGYNIIFAWPELKALAAGNLDAARNKLMDILANYQGFRGMTLILVFDAYRVRGGRGSIEKYHNIHVVYTKEAQTADAYIEKTVHEIGRNERVTVATSDGLEQTIVFGEGAVRMSAGELYEAVKQTEEEIRSGHLGKSFKIENRIMPLG
ncbi:MAG: TetM/TetW/TetO/TetS family tetracycline resistance ribosomal protection protein [Eubacteriales bacterium]|nr:TetM/TetW/TetO/TetS family tetracycline resistance ribosomal protection protein [Eubacteriales bacterium]